MAKTAALPSPNPATGSKKSLKTLPLLLAAFLLLAAAGGAAWHLGLFGNRAEEATASQEGTSTATRPPVLVDLPAITINLPASAGRRAILVRAVAKLEVAGPEDADMVRALMPRVIDVLQTRIRDMRREEFQNTAAIARLRAEILASVIIATAPAQVQNVLFEQLTVQ